MLSNAERRFAQQKAKGRVKKKDFSLDYQTVLWGRIRKKCGIAEADLALCRKAGLI